VLRLVEPTEGSIKIDGKDITRMDKSELRPFRRELQIIFQDPYASLNPRITVGNAIGEALAVHGLAAGQGMRDAVGALLQKVGLRPDVANRFPHEFSGGQRQRVAIARAFLKDAPMLILDEATSHLDAVNEQAVRGALHELMTDRTTVIVAHRLSTIRNADQIVVMSDGRVVEAGSHDALLARGGAYARLVARQISSAAAE